MPQRSLTSPQLAPNGRAIRTGMARPSGYQSLSKNAVELESSGYDYEKFARQNIASDQRVQLAGNDHRTGPDNSYGQHILHEPAACDAAAAHHQFLQHSFVGDAAGTR